MNEQGRDNSAFEHDDHEVKLQTHPLEDSSGQDETQQTSSSSSLWSAFCGRYKNILDKLLLVAVVLAYHAYFIFCIARHVKEDIPIWSCNNCTGNTSDSPYWCDSLAFLIIITALTWAGVIYGYVLKPLLGKPVKKLAGPLVQTLSRATELEVTFYSLKMQPVVLLLYAVPVVALIIYVIVSWGGNGLRLISLMGIAIFVAIGWIFSAHPRKVKWRHIVWGLLIQFVFALIVLKWDFGRDVVSCLSSKVSTFLGYTDAGSEMVYGYLITDRPFIPGNFHIQAAEGQPVPADLEKTGRTILSAINDSKAFGGGGNPFMFKVLSLIFFLSFFVSMLYYWGVLQFIVLKLGWLLYVTVGTTAAESMNAAANIFLGQTEAPLLIKPFLPLMTKSEIHAVMTGGFATIAGTVLGAYIGIGINASDLITASVMAAPTSLAVSKLFYPETEKSKTTIKDVKIEKGEDANVLDAAAKGASTAVMLVLNIAASLIAFKAFVAFLDAIVGWLGIFAGVEDLSFQLILGYLFWPLAFIMGIKYEDCLIVAKLIGMKLLVTELPAFQELAAIQTACAADPDSEEYKGSCTLDPRSITLATYALCGFANFASIGIQIGGLSAMAPERKSDIAQIVLRAMIAGCWVSFLNACVAGVLLD